MTEQLQNLTSAGARTRRASRFSVGLARVADHPIDGLVDPLFDGLRVVEVGGDHDSMLMHPHVSAIAELLAAVDGAAAS